jgi:Cu-processing system permease protein
LLFTTALFVLGYDVSKVVISLTNVILLFCPLIATMLGVMYYYNSREFIELLLAQPIKRRDIFLGQYLGLALSLSGSLLVGIGVPFIIYGIFASAEIWNFSILLVVGVMLSFVFSALAYLIALRNENRLIGFALAIMTWLFFAVIYDGIFLLLLSFFKEYPLDSFAIGASLFNPIDLSRILVLLKLDISALLGFTGAVFNKFFGSIMGMLLSFGVLAMWVIVPIFLINRIARSKDF